MQIFVQTLTGLPTITLEVDPSGAISAVAGKHGAAAVKESNLLRLRGGAKKRKKKTFTTAKKQHHEKKKEPLSVLRMYKVDEASGSVQRLRKECPGPNCGPGVFMAAHSDRLTCGKCGLTFVDKVNDDDDDGDDDDGDESDDDDDGNPREVVSIED